MKRMRRRSSAPEPLPLLSMTPHKQEADDHRRNWQLVTASGRFGLPDGWSVQEVPRNSYTSSCSTRVDRYYIEPNTGQKFRSLVAVHRYLRGGEGDTHGTRQDKVTTLKKKASSTCNMMENLLIDNVNPQMRISPHTRRCSSSFVLPDGWEIEEKPRKNTSTCHTDRYYIEPGTGRRFRSLVAVERYLTEEIEQTPLQALIPSNKLILSSGSSSQKKKIRSLKFVSKNSSHSNVCNRTLDTSRLNTYSAPAEHFSCVKKEIPPEISTPLQLNISSQPPKVKWVLVSPGGNNWNPFMNDTRVPDSVKQKWSEIFKSSIYDETRKPSWF